MLDRLTNVFFAEWIKLKKSSVNLIALLAPLVSIVLSFMFLNMVTSLDGLKFIDKSMNEQSGLVFAFYNIIFLPIIIFALIGAIAKIETKTGNNISFRMNSNIASDIYFVKAAYALLYLIAINLVFVLIKDLYFLIYLKKDIFADMWVWSNLLGAIKLALVFTPGILLGTLLALRFRMNLTLIMLGSVSYLVSNTYAAVYVVKNIYAFTMLNHYELAKITNYKSDSLSFSEYQIFASCIAYSILFGGLSKYMLSKWKGN